jgi:predicted  nucleic acid-binding Zn-ribbon protein
METLVHLVTVLFMVLTSTATGGIDRVKSIVDIAKELLKLFKRLRNGKNLDRSEVEHIRDQLVALLNDLIVEIGALREKVEQNTFAMRALNETIQEAMEDFRAFADLLEWKYNVPANKIRDLIPHLKDLKKKDAVG